MKLGLNVFDSNNYFEKKKEKKKKKKRKPRNKIKF